MASLVVSITNIGRATSRHTIQSDNLYIEERSPIDSSIILTDCVDSTGLIYTVGEYIYRQCSHPHSSINIKLAKC